jgi:hypothetical protein
MRAPRWLEVDVLEAGPRDGQRLEFDACVRGPAEQRGEVAGRGAGGERQLAVAALDRGGGGQRQVAGVDAVRHVKRNTGRGDGAAAERVRRARAMTRPRAMTTTRSARCCLVHVVRRQQDRLAALAQARDELPGLAPGGGVEAGGRLVEEDQLGVARDAERQVQPAALAARQRGDPRAGLLTEPDEVDDLRRRPRGRVGGAVQLDRLADAEPSGASRR